MRTIVCPHCGHEYTDEDMYKSTTDEFMTDLNVDRNVFDIVLGDILEIRNW